MMSLSDNETKAMKAEIQTVSSTKMLLAKSASIAVEMHHVYDCIAAFKEQLLFVCLCDCHLQIVRSVPAIPSPFQATYIVRPRRSVTLLL